MENIAYPIIAVVVWAVAGFKLVQQFKEPNLQRGVLIVLIGAPGVSYMVAAPVVYHRVNALLGVPNIGTVIVYWGIMVFAFCAIAWLTGVLHPREQLIRRLWPWAAGYAAATALMAVLFAMAPVDVEAEGSTGFDAMYADAPYVPWFLVTFHLSFAVALLAIGPACWRWSRVTDRAWLRRGLPLIAVAAGCAMLYILPKDIYIVLRQFDVRVDALNTFAPLGAMASSLFFLIGFLLCAMGPVGDFRLRWRAYQAIHPMWRSLVGPFPELVLHGAEGPRNPRWALWPLRLKRLLYRRIVECRDARLRLRPWFDATIAEQAAAEAAAAGLSGLEADARVEAVLLRSAIARHHSGSRVRDADAASNDTAAEARWYAEGDLAAEARWLTAVAKHFHSPGRTRRVPRWRVQAVSDTELPPVVHEQFRRLVLFDLPTDMKIGMNLAFYRTFGIPRIAAVLSRTREIPQRTRKRADDTGLIMYLLFYYGFEHPHGHTVLQRLNRMHHRHTISNEEYLYVLACLVVVPTRWAAEHGRRALTRGERDAMLRFHRDLGQRMGIGGIPDSYEELERFLDTYEREHQWPNPAGRQLIAASRQLLADRFPRWLRPLARRCADAMLDQKLRRALGVPDPGPLARAGLRCLLRSGIVGKQPSHGPAFYPGIPVRSYPHGYALDRIGPADV